MEIWRLLRSGSGDAAWNMALDEALLLEGPQRRTPTLRFYGWNQPAATFGYFQPHATILRLTSLRPLIRRPTGGGLVPHLADWTYAVAIPPEHEWFRTRAATSYERLHRWLQRAFTELGVDTQLAPAPQTEGPGQCFVGAERHDLLHAGRKIAGAAQRRNRHGLLIQGSIQPPPAGMARAAWEAAVCRAAEALWPIGWQTEELPDRLAEASRALVAAKYSQPAYNGRR